MKRVFSICFPFVWNRMYKEPTTPPHSLVITVKVPRKCIALLNLQPHFLQGYSIFNHISGRNRICRDSDDIITTLEGPTRIRLNNNPEAAMRWCSLKYFFRAIYVFKSKALVKRYVKHEW